MDTQDAAAGPAAEESPAQEPAIDTTKTLCAGDLDAIDDRELAPVPVPAWSGTVWVRTLTADQRDDFVSRFIASDTGRIRSNVRQVTATLLAMTACDERGALLFPDLNVGREVFGKLSALNVDPLFEKAMSLNKLSAGDIEEIAGN